MKRDITDFTVKGILCILWQIGGWKSYDRKKESEDIK